MRPLADDSRHDELAQQIAWAAEARSGSDLFFVVANTHAAREGFSRALRAAAPGTLTVDLTDERRRFLSVLRDLPAGHTVLVTGLEPHARAAESRGSLFGGLNLDRDAIRREDRNLVFLLPSFALSVLAQSTPDFYDFRTATLEVPEELGLQGLTSLRTDGSVRALNPQERDRWIHLLRSQRLAANSIGEIERQINLATLLKESGDLAAAERTLRDLLAHGRLKETFEDQYTTALNDLGSVLYAKGDLDGALDAIHEAKRIDQSVVGNDHPNVARDINHIGTVLYAKGDLNGALASYLEAERIDRRIYGNDHPEVATRINNVGGVLMAQGDLASALAAYKEAERMDRATLGDDHSSVARDIRNQAGVVRVQGNLEGALALALSAERIDRAALGDGHPRVAKALSCIGRVLYDSGNLNEALTAFEEAERINRATYGDNHYRVADDLNNIGRVLYDLGNMKEALVSFEDALIVTFRSLGALASNAAAIARNVAFSGNDPVALVRERFGDDAAQELAEALGQSVQKA